MQLFYHANAQIGIPFHPEAEEAKHILKVLRKKDGDEMMLTNGKGSVFTCTLESTGRSVSLIPKSERKFERPSPSLQLAIAPLKNAERTEWFVEKAVEIGVSEIHLIECEHSERTHVRMERLERIAISAMKQSLKFWLPQIHASKSLADFLLAVSGNIKFIAHCSANHSRQFLKEVLFPAEDALICIGPEGDFSADEIVLAEKYGFISVSLGEARLRTETAGVVAVHTFALINQLAISKINKPVCRQVDL